MLHLTATFHLMGGAVGGLCAATPSSGYVSPSGSMIIGLVAGVLCYFADHKLMKAFLEPRGIDDVVSVFPVHGIGGLWGTLATGLLAVESVGGVKGAIEGNWSQVGVQATSMLIVCAWSAAGTSLITFGVSHLTKLRATEEEEIMGLDSRPYIQSPRSRKSSMESPRSSASQESPRSTRVPPLPIASMSGQASKKRKKPTPRRAQSPRACLRNRSPRRCPRLFPFGLYVGFDRDLLEKLQSSGDDSSEEDSTTTASA